MNPTLFRYQFQESVPMSAVESDLALALLAAEGLFGRSRVALEGGVAYDEGLRACVIDADTHIGRTINLIFAGLLHRFIGEGNFFVKRLNRRPEPQGDPQSETGVPA